MQTQSQHISSPEDDGPGNAPAAAVDSSAGLRKALRGRILLVEDEFLVAMAMESDLKDAGFDIVGIANSADGAVVLARAERPDLVLMDIRLVGRRDGITAALEIFAETGIRCIFATAHGDAQSRERAASASPLGWLQKPYGREALLESVQQAIQTLHNSN